jgi:WD40 repeat protein
MLRTLIVGSWALVIASVAHGDSPRTVTKSSTSEVAVKIADLPAGHSGIVYSVAFSPDGEHIAIVSLNGKINIWDWHSARVVSTITTPLGFNELAATNPMTYSPDGQFLAVADGRGPANEFVRIWNTKTWSVAKDIVNGGVGGSTGMSFTPDGRFLLYTIGRNGNPGDTLAVYSVTDWQQAWGLPIPGVFNAESIAVSPDGAHAAMGGTLMVITADTPDMQHMPVKRLTYIVDLRERQIIRTISGDAMGPIAWSPDGTRIAVAGELYVEMFDAQSGKALVHEKVEGSARMNVRFTPNGRYFLESDMNGLRNPLGLKIWDSTRHILLQEIPGEIGDIALSRDGEYLAVATTGRTTVWRLNVT